MNNKLFLHAFVSLLSSFIFITTNTAQANIFKCVNQKGAVYYNDKPCPVDNKETKLKAVKDPKNGYIPEPYVEKKEEINTAEGVIVGKETTEETTTKIDKEKNREETLSGNSKDKIASKSNLDTPNSLSTGGSNPSSSNQNQSTPPIEKGDTTGDSTEKFSPKVAGKPVKPPALLE